jgi:hypothetical protein
MIYNVLKGKLREENRLGFKRKIKQEKSLEESVLIIERLPV